ncbi:toxin-antitoxin system YwqK family antitoxin [Flavobacterium lipolyticum]|uniref:Toxin-antitoxin system YwqK family antitoxin n=1 Tax=Flavobacterium lipolyticum TaxID=2893754 RepID=A0ABS8LWW8_9FLAO|nr:hypothetical protein [Flavobacterium sp. F-126]MCC9016463.1 hypothetical protein [Flavobacterium sp. F-126]
MKIFFYPIIALLLFYSCKTYVSIPPTTEGFNISSNNHMFEDFPSEYIGVDFYRETFSECGYRIGKTGIDGLKESKWLSGDADFDKNGNVVAKGKIYKEEYFKHGLRDSIFRQFDNDGKVIYETTFKMGTGLWKEFHDNRKVYFEAYTKDGYFTDTLRLYNKEGKNFEKRLYQKDVLVYYIGNDWCLRYRYKPNDSAYLEVDSYELKNLKQGAFRNTFSYKTKEEYENDHFAKSTLKR